MKKTIAIFLLSMSIIYADNEIQGGRNLYSNGYIPPVEDTIQVEDSIQAVNTPQEDISIKALFDTPKISKNALQKLASIAPVKIVAQAKPAVKVKKTAEPESTIQAIGYGNSEDEALKGAYQNAVEQYVGVLVDSSTIIQNDQLIKNDILTFSNGYIESYKKLSSKEQMGLWEVKIDAVIKKQNVLEKIKALNIDPIDIKDSEQTYAKLVTQVQSKFDAEDMLIALVKETVGRQAISGHPFQSREERDLVQENVSFLKYIDLKIDDIHLDTDRATRKVVPVTIKYSANFNWNEYNKIANKFEKLFVNIGAKLVSTKEISDPDRDTEYTERGKAIISVVFKKNNKLFMNRWEFPKSFAVIHPFLNEWGIDESGNLINPMINLTGLKEYSLDLLDSNNEVIRNECLNYYFTDNSLFNCEDCNSPQGKKALFIGPTFHSYEYGHESLNLNKSHTFDMDLNLIKNLKQVKIKWDREGQCNTIGYNRS